MPRRRHRVLAIALLILSFSGTAVAVHAEPRREPPAAQDPRSRQQSQQERASLTPAEAAAKARARHGGKVLKVQRKGDGYRVRLLQDSGRVITVTIKG
ncbi:MAG: hypothetical protein U5K56_10005 [Halioglobus sp.]|nr:hypothetical protein [Halioglobus sp.]